MELNVPLVLPMYIHGCQTPGGLGWECEMTLVQTGLWLVGMRYANLQAEWGSGIGSHRWAAGVEPGMDRYVSFELWPSMPSRFSCSCDL